MHAQQAESFVVGSPINIRIAAIATIDQTSTADMSTLSTR